MSKLKTCLWSSPGAWSPCKQRKKLDDVCKTWCPCQQQNINKCKSRSIKGHGDLLLIHHAGHHMTNSQVKFQLCITCRTCQTLRAKH